jgi:hypothetical protein
MAEPRSLATILVEQMKQFEPGSREYRTRHQVLSGVTSVRALRELVLSHPDLAAKLCQPPLNFTKPTNWNGFVAPDLFNGERNDSPYRKALAAIVAEAMDRGAQ